jgi:hypothetical protein
MSASVLLDCGAIVNERSAVGRKQKSSSGTSVLSESRSIQFRRSASGSQPHLELDAQVAELMISILEICTQSLKEFSGRGNHGGYFETFAEDHYAWCSYAVVSCRDAGIHECPIEQGKDGLGHSDGKSQLDRQQRRRRIWCPGY